MRVAAVVLAGLVITLVQPGRGVARPLFHRAALSIASDGSPGGPVNSNPSTNVLGYGAGVYELGYRLRHVGVHGRAGLALISGDETTGSGLTLGGGVQALLRLPGLRLVLRGDLDLLHASYDFKDESTSIDALVFEPSLGLELPLGHGRPALGLQIGPRWKWIMGESARSPQSGLTVSLALVFGGDD